MHLIHVLLISYFCCSKTLDMSQLGERISKKRKELGLSQTDLANKVGVSYAQIGRYETKGVQPPAEVLNKIADELNTSIDYLINGESSEKAINSLKTTEVLNHFKEVESLPEKDKNIILNVIGAFVRDYKTRQAYL